MNRIATTLIVSIGLSMLTTIVTADVYELRTYTTNAGKLDNLNARFRDHTVALFEKHGIQSIGYWVPVAKENTLVYVIKHKSRDTAKASWQAFIADPAWKKVARESQLDGNILAKAPESVYMETTDYSATWKNGSADDDDLFELRIYKAAEGKLGKLDARFRDHTIRLFEKHGMRNVAYWHPTDEPNSKDHLIYIIKHESRAAAKASWQAFGADPDWKKAAAASGVGRLAKPPASTYMKATDYSAIK
ncbi:MAG TPA: NIPSNAP family protein [Planctomycetes bacterium]|nr:NIPSNAP family protein [Planctomycetota bacterium]